MGRQKEELARHEELYHTAQNIAKSAGAIEECAYHPGTFTTCDDQDAEKRAYAIGTNKIKEGEIDCKREELMDAIKNAISDAGDECYSCEKWKHE
jgi:hypothetical protein